MHTLLCDNPKPRPEVPGNENCAWKTEAWETGRRNEQSLKEDSAHWPVETGTLGLWHEGNGYWGRNSRGVDDGPRVRGTQSAIKEYTGVIHFKRISFQSLGPVCGALS